MESNALIFITSFLNVRFAEFMRTRKKKEIIKCCMLAANNICCTTSSYFTKYFFSVLYNFIIENLFMCSLPDVTMIDTEK